MADIRCPMCGRPNPADQEVCRFCQARLKPLVISPSPEEEKPVRPEDRIASKKPPEPDSSIPDWLRDLRQKDEDEPEPAPPGAVPDWLSEEPEQASSTGEARIGDTSDWLRDLRQKDEEEARPEQQESLPDWSSEEPEEAAPSGESNLGEASDWWSRISRESEAGEQPAPGGIAPEPASPLGPVSQPPEETPAKSDEALPDWLATLSSDDFLGLGSQKEREESSQAPSPTPPTGEEEGEEPGWLRRVRARQKSEEQPLTQAFLPDEEEEVPGSGVDSFETPAKQEQESDLPDWLSSLAPQEPVSGEPAQGLPEWLLSSQAEPEPETPAPEEATPDWLSRLSAQDQGNLRWSETAQPEQQEAVPPSEEGSLPDWLASLETGASDQTSQPNVPAFVYDEETELPADQGGQVESISQETEKEQEEAASYLTTLPEWISQVSEEGENTEGASTEEEEPGLAPAQLPTWLEAMRPVEAAAPAAPVGDELTPQVEKVGPLAGLRGVIPAEPVIGHLRKPPVYSVKLQMSESQRQNTALLQKLLEGEGEAKPILQRPAFASQAVLRLIIAVALILAVLVPLWLNSQQLPLPDPTYIPDGIVEVGEQISKVNSGSPVLVAIDYEAGLSAEMDAAASTIVNKIASQGGALALVSTNPAGPLLAERLMSKINQRRGENPIHYANLGFIAGGQAGLASFARAPSEALPFDLGSSTQPARADLWEAGPFSQVRSAADFVVVVVITENPDTARNWIEQTQPLLGQKHVPLLMMVSAQAEPMVRPYFEGSPQQVNGIVAGLNGVAAYERQSQQPGLARSYWDAFCAGLLVAEALILVGGSINIILALFMPRKGSDVEGTQ